MARRYVMTARRRTALRKAQLVSARRRKGRGKQWSKKKRVAVGVGSAAVVAGGATVAYKATYINLYHNTGHHRARMIAKKGFKAPTARSTQAKYGQLNGTVSTLVQQNTYMTTRKRGVARMYGADTVKVRVRRSQLKTLGRTGHYQPTKAKKDARISRYSRHERYLAIPTQNLSGRKVRHVRTTGRQTLRKNGTYPLF